MAESELEVIKKSKQLMLYTYRITSNCRKFPKKYRFSLIDRMQNKCMDIYEYLDEANNTNLKTSKAERLHYQTRVIRLCTQMLYYIELSVELNITSVDTMEYWSKMVKDIKHMTLSWRKKDKER